MKVIVKITDEIEPFNNSGYCQLCGNEPVKYYLKRLGWKIGESCKDKFTEAVL